MEDGERLGITTGCVVSLESPLKSIECVLGPTLVAASMGKDDRRGMVEKGVHSDTKSEP